MGEFLFLVFKSAVKAVVFWLVLAVLMAYGLVSFGAMITHSHCPNHSRNNSENMHTHDTTEAGHNDKHKVGHPHTWEFDEFCPPGTERDTSKKSRGIQEFPVNAGDPVLRGTGVESPASKGDDGGFFASERSAPEAVALGTLGFLVRTPRVIVSPVSVTEYMIRDGGNRRLPVWIEVYNPNPEPVSLRGYTFTFATRKDISQPWVFHARKFGDFSIPAMDVGLLVSHEAKPHQVDGVDMDRVYDVGIEAHARDLKSGWRIEDTDGDVVHVIGRAFGFASPVLPGSWHTRQSFQVRRSEAPAGSVFYGASNDIGSPGFWEAVRSAPSLVRPKLATKWASLKVSR